MGSLCVAPSAAALGDDDDRVALVTGYYQIQV